MKSYSSGCYVRLQIWKSTSAGYVKVYGRKHSCPAYKSSKTYSVTKTVGSGKFKTFSDMYIDGKWVTGDNSPWITL